MKTNEELKALKAEAENLHKKIAGLSEEELLLVTGGVGRPRDDVSQSDLLGNTPHEHNVML